MADDAQMTSEQRRQMPDDHEYEATRAHWLRTSARRRRFWAFLAGMAKMALHPRRVRGRHVSKA